ncbi:MAG: PPC domain-containing DNA-binding protein [Cyanobacteria bacterium P01_F01_bin.53]
MLNNNGMEAPLSHLDITKGDIAKGDIAKGTVQSLSLRLHPGADIRRDLEALSQKENISAGVILGAVGSLSQVNLRFAGEHEHTLLEGKHEILTLSGMLGKEGVHLHMSVANSQGECRGGHVVYGCVVYTTLELAIAIMPEVAFQRVLDQATGFKELKIVAPSNQ